MKMKNKHWIFPLLLGFALMLTNSCEKDEEQVLLPVITTSSVNDVTQTTAAGGGNITSDGGAAVISKGVCWNTTVNPTVSNSKTSNGTGTGAFASSISGLNPGTTYHVRAYATTKLGTAYGAEVVFVTPERASPLLVTMEVSSITQTRVICGGNISSDRGSAVTDRGIYWGTNDNPTRADNRIACGSGSGGFSSSITGLTPGTTYYVRAYAVNSIGIAYGETKAFTTSSVATPVVATSLVEATYYSATSGGTISLSGGAPITAKGVCWSTTNLYPTILDSKTDDGAGSAAYVSTLSGLTPGTPYFARAYATNGTSTGYGDLIAFSTPALAVPSLSRAVRATAITQTTATSGGTVTNERGTTVTARGICWNTSANPTISNSKTVDGAGLGSFTSSITGLLGGTTYYVRAYATNTTGTGYGDEITFVTPSPVLSLVTTTEATAVTQTTATSGGNVTYTGGALIIERGVCWSETSTTPNIINSTKLAVGSGTGVFTASLTGLLGSTTYYLRAYSTTDVGTSYGSVITFTTPAPVMPVLAATTAASAITKISATSGGNVTSTGGALVTERGICWNTSTNPTTANSKLVVGSGTGSFTGSMTGLTANTTYYVRSYAINSVGTAYGTTVVSFKTLP